MKHLLVLLTVLFALLAPTSAFACDKGDTQMGPNCVHVEEWEVTSAAGFYGPLYESTVYRGEGDAKKVLWKDLGEVKESTKDHIKTETRMEKEDGTVEVVTSVYHWDGKTYR